MDDPNKKKLFENSILKDYWYFKPLNDIQLTLNDANQRGLSFFNI